MDAQQRDDGLRLRASGEKPSPHIAQMQPVRLPAVQASANADSYEEKIELVGFFRGDVNAFIAGGDPVLDRAATDRAILDKGLVFGHGFNVDFDIFAAVRALDFARFK
jgi:hypothetical protein